ncbi:hypothetical protein K439DRAFT_1366904 [Ramaria rubella]|nr:hypothetical protein K439DRAFT_1366904 [Ramaria rubella]
MGYLLSLQPTFTQGLIIGQLSILILLALILKYLFLVSDPSTTQHLPTTTAIPHSPLKQEAPLHPRTGDIEWLNVILKHLVQTYRSELHDNLAGSEGVELCRAKIERHINNMRPSVFVDPIFVHSVNLGSSAPHLSNARVSTSTIHPNGQIELDMTYTDTSSISLSTSILFNYPLPYFARLPVSLTMSLSVFSSKILLTLPHPTSPTPTLTFALAPTFTLDLHISSLLGSRAKLADVPKLHDMIESQIKKTLAARGSWTIVLPGITRPQGGTNVHSPSEEIDVKLINECLGHPLPISHLVT